MLAAGKEVYLSASSMADRAVKQARGVEAAGGVKSVSSPPNLADKPLGLTKNSFDAVTCPALFMLCIASPDPFC